MKGIVDYPEDAVLKPTLLILTDYVDLHSMKNTMNYAMIRVVSLYVALFHLVCCMRKVSDLLHSIPHLSCASLNKINPFEIVSRLENGFQMHAEGDGLTVRK
uniref:Uncharacterized protein n=1 Tax=Anguilla anguilla TaxID=7936 RepID=A0A0E9QET6_ANGAN